MDVLLGMTGAKFTRKSAGRCLVCLWYLLRQACARDLERTPVVGKRLVNASGMRMRQGTADGRVVQRDARGPGRVRNGGIGESAGARDVQIGNIFRNMRLSMKASREMISRRLATSPSTIDDFEAGAIGALPHWKETTRTVRGYCELLRVDPEPILWRIRSHLEAAALPV